MKTSKTSKTSSKQSNEAVIEEKAKPASSKPADAATETPTTATSTAKKVSKREPEKKDVAKGRKSSKKTTGDSVEQLELKDSKPVPKTTDVKPNVKGSIKTVEPAKTIEEKSPSKKADLKKNGIENQIVEHFTPNGKGSVPSGTASTQKTLFSFLKN